MNKSELIAAFADEMGIPEFKARKIVETILDGMSEALARGEGVELRGFGSFSIRNYDVYIGRNPKTGEVIKVKPKRLPFFKVGKELREAVNSNR